MMQIKRHTQFQICEFRSWWRSRGNMTDSPTSLSSKHNMREGEVERKDCEMSTSGEPTLAECQMIRSPGISDMRRVGTTNQPDRCSGIQMICVDKLYSPLYWLWNVLKLSFSRSWYWQISLPERFSRVWQHMSPSGWVQAEESITSILKRLSILFN